jgi:SAM-dependent methyltransferase
MRIGIDGAKECVDFLLKTRKFDSILDIGCGRLPYKPQFKNTEYVGIDLFKKVDDECITIADFREHDFGRKFDCVFSSHVIEHIPDTEAFLRRVKHYVKDGGTMCILFPKPKPEVVGGHVHIFNPGILLYNLTRIGIDCSDWDVVERSYTYGIMGTCKKVPEKDLVYGSGDIEMLSDQFPFNARQNFHGINAVGMKRL